MPPEPEPPGGERTHEPDPSKWVPVNQGDRLWALSYWLYKSHVPEGDRLVEVEEKTWEPGRDNPDEEFTLVLRTVEGGVQVVNTLREFYQKVPPNWNPY